MHAQTVRPQIQLVLIIKFIVSRPLPPPPQQQPLAITRIPLTYNLTILMNVPMPCSLPHVQCFVQIECRAHTHTRAQQHNIIIFVVEHNILRNKQAKK